MRRLPNYPLYALRVAPSEFRTRIVKVFAAGASKAQKDRTMSECEQLEVAIEKRLHGALDTESAQALERHLASCAACRAFEALATKTEETMTTAARSHNSAMQWTDVKSRLDRMIAARRRLTVRGAAIALVVTGAAVLVLGEPGLAAGSVAAIVAAAATVILANALHGRALVRPSRLRGLEGGDLFDFYRRQLDREILSARISRLALPLVGAAVVTAAASLSGGAQRWTAVGAAVAAALYCVAKAVLLHFVELPRLERERDQLR
jgi:hypothetical protein